jgi:hypothetical protein
MSQKYKYLDKHNLKLINHISDKILKFNRTLTDAVIDDLPDDKFFPIVFTMIHEHRAGVPCEPHVRCMITVPDKLTNKMIRLTLDIDTSIFDALPEVELPDAAGREKIET